MIKALIIDDDINVQTILQRVLGKRLGCDVFLASDGIEGLAMIRKHKPDIIFCDVNMPLMNGLEVLEVLNENPDLGKSKVIMITSVNDKAIIDKIVAHGVTDFILKPLHYDFVQERLKKIVNQLKTARLTENSNLLDKNSTDRKTILIADKDVSFRAFFSDTLKDRFDIIETANGLDCLQAYIAEHPHIVLVCEGLEVLNEFLLVKKIRNDSMKTSPAIYLINDSGELEEKGKGIFDGAVRRSFVKESFKKLFFEAVGYRSSELQQHINLIQTRLHSSIRQAMGEILKAEITFFNNPMKVNPEGMACGSVSCINESGTILFTIDLLGMALYEEGLQKITGIPEGAKSAAYSAHLVIAKLIAEKLILSLSKNELRFRIESSVAADVEPDRFNQPKDITITLETDENLCFIVQMQISERE